MASERYFSFCAGLSLVIHGGVLASFCEPSSAEAPIPFIEVDIGGLDGFDSQSGLSNVDQAEKIQVPKKLLPQLPKHQQKVRPNKVENSAVSEVLPAEEVLPLTQAELRQRERIKRKALRELEKKRVGSEDLARRLLKEKARKELKMASVVTSPEVEKTMIKASVQDQLGTAAASAEEFHQFIRSMERAIGQYYSLPEVYKYRLQGLKSAVMIQLADDGQLLSIRLETSSGDPQFDAMSLQIIRRAEPLPIPPAPLASHNIIVHFAPFSSPSSLKEETP